MTKKRPVLIHIANAGQSAQSPAFVQNIQTALLLSLLDKKLLTQWQFDQCQDQVKKAKYFENNSCKRTV